ncbi:hypothetical protein GGD41_000104 [Paraburkholderia bryophila]|uniref:Uncharacterized protein n=1 Tax=Paraburkholderia bryophila TaxID=420952 RepID=A0A7Z0AWU2_9BURK|nr:hypothetical protein [Paraburkholderia bryophila]
MRKGYELQVEIRRDAAFYFDQRLDGEQARIAHVDVTANRQQPACDGPIAILQRAFDQRFLRQVRLQFAPQRDAFEQGARRVHARQAVRQRRVHVEVRIDERRRDERAGGVDFFGRACGQIRLDGDDAAGFDADVDRVLVLRRGARRQRRAADDQIHVSLLGSHATCLY